MDNFGKWVIGLNVGPIETNCYILLPRAGHGATVIDPGFDAERITGVLRSRDIPLERILLTHAHIDHLYALEEVYCFMDSRESGIFLHFDDKKLIEHIEDQAGFLGTETPRLPDAFSPVNDDDILTCSGHSIRVLHTPGHSPGSCSFYMEDEKLVFSGDTLFAGNIGRTDLWGGSREDLDQSIEEKLLSLEDDVVILPGHGPPTTVKEAREFWVL